MEVSDFLTRLMACGQLLRGTKLGPEDRLCIEFAQKLRELTLCGRLRAVWLHVPNEGKRSIWVGQLRRAMGMQTGCPDYLFLTPTGAYGIEFKAKRGTVRPSQKDFRAWMEEAGVGYALVRSVEDGIRSLESWNLVDG